MRTPGHDFELAAGFLLTEGVVSSAAQIERVRRCGGPDGRCAKNVVTVELRPDVAVDLDRLKRHFYTSSSCGVCGKTSLAAVRVGFASGRLPAPSSIPPSSIGCQAPCGRRRPFSTAPAACTPRRCSTSTAICFAYMKTWAGTTPWTS